MAKHHFDDNNRPKFSKIVDDILQLLAVEGVCLEEVYLVGGYATEIESLVRNSSSNTLDALLPHMQKTAGDVDLIVSYSLEDGVTSFLSSSIIADLNRGTSPDSKNWKIDVIFREAPIQLKRPPLVRLYPTLDVQPAT